MIDNIVCANCEESIGPDRDSAFCPICGSGDRLIEIRDEHELKMYETIRIKKRPSGDKKPSEEIKAGDDFHHKSSQWNHLERIIDRENNRYFEHIEDAEGNVIRHTDEPLTEHRGHGDARHAKTPPK